MDQNRTRPTLNENNRIYLYRLLKEAIGCGKQTFITAVDEALDANGLAPQEIGYADARELLEDLDDFVKLTVFKGGRVYATLSTVDAWDEALAQPEKDGSKAAGAKGKSWKKKKGAKALKPQRPKRVKREGPKAQAKAAPTDETSIDLGAGTESALDQTAGDAEPAATTSEDQAVMAVDEPKAQPAQAGTDAPENTASQAPSAIEVAEDVVDTADGDAPDAAQKTVDTASSAPAHTEIAAPAFDFKDYPIDFSREVFCPGDLLADLSALLPWGADALGIVGEYYWIARERNTIEAKRGRARFSLRYTRDGERHEAAVAIKRRNSHDGAAWAIESVSCMDEGRDA